MTVRVHETEESLTPNPTQPQPSVPTPNSGTDVEVEGYTGLSFF